MDILDQKEQQAILVIASTNREGSLTEIVSRLYVSLLEKRGVSARILSLSRLEPDFIGKALYKNRGKDPAFNDLVEDIEKAQKMVFVVPQYNGSFPGVLKTFIDGLKVGASDKGEVFRYKKCALVGVSRGMQGNILGLSHLTDILTYLGMHVYPQKLYFSRVANESIEAFEKAGDYVQSLEKQVDGLINF